MNINVEYVDGLRNSVYALINEQLYTKSNKNYWKCRHPDCSSLVKIVDGVASQLPKHPMHSEVTALEIQVLKVIKAMKVEAAKDEHTDLKVNILSLMSILRFLDMIMITILIE